jgi:hypothetical protein
VPTLWLGKLRLAGDKPTAVPTPARGTNSESPELSWTLIADLRDPEAVGEKVTLSLQVPPGAKVLGEMGQLLFWLKSLLLPPAMAMAVRVRLAVPRLLTVTVCAALVVVRSQLPKFRLPGENVMGARTPVPLSATVCGLAGPSSAKRSEALSEPSTQGLKITLNVQEPPGRTASPVQVSAPLTKSVGFVPVSPTLVILRYPVPVLVRVTVCAALAVLTA